MSSSSQPAGSAPRKRGPGSPRLFSGGGEMGALMRALDWSKTPIGPVSTWPQSLKTAVRIILTSRYAMFVWWGRELVNLYNDPYRAFLGIKHPAALGKSAREVWAEIWDQIGPRTDAVFLRGESTYDEALLLLMERHGYMEETYFTFSYSPLPDEKGNVGGLFCAVTEETQQVIGERRLRLLREIASAMAGARTPVEVCQAAADCLVNARRDLPFSLIYLAESDGKTLRRAAIAGVHPFHPGAPEKVILAEGSDQPWPFRRVIENNETVYIEDLRTRVSDVPQGEWNQPPECAVVLPIAQQGNVRPAGVFVAGLNPYRKFDDDFRGFVSLLGSQIAAAIATAVAYETERQRAENLAKLDRAKTLFFSNVSHELRTPLTLMLGPLEEVLSKARERLAGEDRQHLLAAQRNALRLLKLVNTLLDFSRIESGRVEVVYQPTDLPLLTAEIASVFRSAFEKAGLRFGVQCEPLNEPIYVDREMWEKIVLNLLSNAFKYTFEGEISLTLKLVGDSVELAVRDTGVGIPADELSRVFERFHRIETMRARTHEGTGIGLALVQELAKLHGGNVRAESEVGRGTTFIVSTPRGSAHLPADRIQAATSADTVALSPDSYVDEAERWLPQYAGAVATEESHLPELLPNPADASPDTERELIVLADDNADMRIYLSHLLHDEYRVHAVADGAQAVEAVRRLRPVLVITDVMMPGLDGFGVLRSLRNDPALSSTPVIMLSARAGEESRVEGLEAGADDYLVKPFTARELLARVRTHVNMAKLRQEAAQREARLHKATEQNEERLRLAQTAAQIGTWEWDPIQDVRSLSPELHAMFGTTAEDPEHAKKWAERVHAEDFDEVQRLMFDGHRSGGMEFEYRYLHPALGLRWFYCKGRRLPGETRMFGVVQDITDRKLAQEAVRQSEQEFRGLANAIPQLVWMASADGWIYWYNDRWYEYTGTTPAQMEGWGWHSVHDPEHLPTVLERWKACIASGEPFEMTFPLRGADGVFRPFLTRAVPMRDRQGNITRWFGTNTDVSGEVRIQEELRKSEEKLQAALFGSQKLAAIVESSDDAIVGKDLNGIVTSWNPRAERMFGYTAQEMIGRSIATIIPPELLDDETRILQTIARGERIEHFETVRVKKNGERIEVSLTVSPVRDETGNVIGAAKIARDITQRRKAERALHTSERLASVGRLAATVAHEINNPLEAVTNLIYLARQDADSPEVRRYLVAAEEELERISHLTKQTLGFYRETRGTSSMRLGNTIQPLISVFGSKLRSKAVEIRPEIKGDPEIQAVPGEIRQLLANLLSNSIDAVDGGGRIRIRISAAREWIGVRRSGVRLTVADSGPGIPPSVRPRLFEPFFTTKKEVGTGLGLWVCRSIVEKHEGSIRVRSCAIPGKSWTAFSVFLPLRPHHSVAEESLKLAV